MKKVIIEMKDGGVMKGCLLYTSDPWGSKAILHPPVAVRRHERDDTGRVGAVGGDQRNRGRVCSQTGHRGAETGEHFHGQELEPALPLSLIHI